MAPLNPMAASFYTGDTVGTVELIPHPTPFTPATTEPVKPLPRYGDNWCSTFPPKKHSSPPKPNPHLLTPSTSDSPSRLLLRRAKSPSLSSLLPAKRNVTPHQTIAHRPSFQALAALLPRHPSPTNTSYLDTNSSSTGSPNVHFAPFDDDDDVVSRAVSIGTTYSTNTHPQSPVSSSGASARLFSEYLDSSNATSSESSSSYENDFGEGRNVYISDLPSHVTPQLLRKYAQQFGRVVSVKVEHGGITADTREMLPEGVARIQRTYAFVMYDSPDAARLLMAEMSKVNVACQLGKETPHLKQKALEDPHSSNLYVAEIPLDFTEDEMRQLMYPGQISSLRFLEDGSRNRRGTAMVRLQSRVQAEEAIARLDFRMTLRGCSKPLQVRIADSEKAYKRKTTLARNGPGLESFRSSMTPKPRIVTNPGFIESPAPSPDTAMFAHTTDKIKHIIDLQKYHVDSRGLDTKGETSPTDSDWWRPFPGCVTTRAVSSPHPPQSMVESLAELTPRVCPKWNPGFHIPNAPASSDASSSPSTPPTTFQDDTIHHARLVNVRP